LAEDEQLAYAFPGDVIDDKVKEVLSDAIFNGG
jgi:hypothetical protein